MVTAVPSRPAPSEHHTYYATYISEVPEGSVLATLAGQIDQTAALLARVPESKASFRYAEGKWSIKEVVGHLADTERVFSYRALRVARGDTTPLASFDENAWVPFGDFDRRTLADLTAELRAVRAATMTLFNSFTGEAWLRTGTASGHPISARALAWIVTGHERHHLRVLAERYFPKVTG